MTRSAPFQCSTTCGKGVRTRTIKCVDTLTNSTIPNDRCVPEERPIAEHRCRMARCPRWRRGKWSMVSSLRASVRMQQTYGYGHEWSIATLPAPDRVCRLSFHLSRAPVSYHISTLLIFAKTLSRV
uniref:Uncharacterized protein n=1 Tax=Plectus sambesii TaxID=2011161 RepID=A0A914WV13_9BILA